MPPKKKSWVHLLYDQKVLELLPTYDFLEVKVKTNQ